MLASGPEFEARPEMHGLTILLIAGVQYLLERGRTIRVFGGIDIREDAGWNVLKQSARALAQTLLGEGVAGVTGVKRAKGH